MYRRLSAQGSASSSLTDWTMWACLLSLRKRITVSTAGASCVPCRTRSRAQGLWLLCVLSHACYFLLFDSSHPGGMRWGLTVAWVCTSLMTSLIPLLLSSFWDWEKGEKLDYFHNGNPRYTRVTAMEYLNGQDCSLLLTATGEWPGQLNPSQVQGGGRTNGRPQDS